MAPPDEAALCSDAATPDHLFHWMEAADRRLRELVLASADRDDLVVHGSPGKVLQLVPAEGSRMTDLADRAGITKQAMGQLIDQLERRGLVESTRLQHDARVRMVRRTDLGEKAVQDITALINAAEQRLSRELGAVRYQQMKDALREISNHN